MNSVSGLLSVSLDASWSVPHYISTLASSDNLTKGEQDPSFFILIKLRILW